MSYTIMIAIKTQKPGFEINDLIQKSYATGTIAGICSVHRREDTHEWAWIKFFRDLEEDAPLIAKRLIASNFQWSAHYAARYQLALEFKDANQPDEVAEMVYQALLRGGDVYFPGCTIPNPLEVSHEA